MGTGSVYQTVDVCQERHASVDGQLGGHERWIESIDRRIWTLILLGIGQLTALVGGLIVVIART